MNQIQRWQEKLSIGLGIGPDRKTEIYLGLFQAASLKDVNYWLQILFAAGIATLGLVLNSPAVIIGAMLISPLMGPILSAGLAFAAGDLVLGIRTFVVLLVSCLVAILLSTTLVWTLPFKEITTEIAARTQPTTLDLMVALFSGAIGSVAICREVKGVVTSIPGVAIAVALMPPLCVVGFGIGVALSLNAGEGLRIARGGGLLFLTNLVGIIFTAMVVFLVLRLNVKSVTTQVAAWHEESTESQLVTRGLVFFRIPKVLFGSRSALSRLAMILAVLLLLLIPLSQSLQHLSREITRQKEENLIQQTAIRLWKPYETLPDGKVRSFLDSVTISALENQLSVTMRVFSSQPYTNAETTQYQHELAGKLGRPSQSVNFQLVEIPTSTLLIARKTNEEKSEPAVPPPSVMHLQSTFWQRVDRALEGVRWPAFAKILGFRVILNEPTRMQVMVRYLGEREFGIDAQDLITRDIQSRLEMQPVTVSYEWIPSTLKPIEFKRNTSVLAREDEEALRRVVEILQQNPNLQLVILANAEPTEIESMAQSRAQAAATYITQQCDILKDKISITVASEPLRTLRLSFRPTEKNEPLR
ncbi:MAG: DUF389 domain-containing protein [Blastocatellia bacterium]|nr:DUF389 domain-containing protein [Blastocatellia bacterium]